MSTSSPSAWAPWHASARFAESLVSRHVREPSHVAPVGRAVVRGARGGVVRVGGRFDVRVSVRFPLVAAPAPAGSGSGGGGAPPPGTYLNAAGSPASKFGASAPTHAERIMARTASLARVPLARRDDRSIEMRRDAAPVSRVVRRGPVAEPAAVAREPVVHRGDGARAPRDARTATRIDATSPLSRPELDRITTHVVDAIDRRIAAARERHGRI